VVSLPSEENLLHTRIMRVEGEVMVGAKSRHNLSHAHRDLLMCACMHIHFEYRCFVMWMWVCGWLFTPQNAHPSADT
jgi:hypothetical protein